MRLTLVAAYGDSESCTSLGACTRKTEQDQRNQMKECECTCHVYGQTHTKKEKQVQTPKNGEALL